MKSKRVADSYCGLDVNYLKRIGALTPGSISTIRWSNRGKPSGSVQVRAQEGRIVLEYRSRSYGGEWEDVVEPVMLCWTPCNYGGKRPWFRCPGVGCGRRVGKLYGAGEYFLCRHCYDLAYGTQNEQWHGRALRKAQDIRMKLGGSPNMTMPFPDKPKGMHWKTYQRLRARANVANESWCGFLANWISRADARHAVRRRRK